ncbi:BlaI/MecI/CopY family transcriptional regulator [Clostridioides sp. ZZV14-6009]|uniref:BlaI/MecI/CopY family transcriptional regulator n=1 Tax=unclassified Clostridioides TaxID=2635829 RepID=UPI001D0FC59F|nr:BlaI/MecI/CopY family transcriptional regulator [Clostridioides sp. ZZV14-6150]MCC0732934.1 BlaI/MecI/CopY family transcriptional regulator [Clostridioides sp. ZZV14-6048]MCC0736847.1 BlaI/MecI/CopY family transcriptional regulator [Clostridioides sp. ZZV14-6009]MCC0744997.1 BlaI/MecI/CopY family transcriptional regulator [Clostridioides sp. ZZV14-6044]
MIKKIPQAELKVMKFIWVKNDIVTSKELIEAMENDCNWKATTTLTLLSRLVNKRFLASDRIKRITHYTILITKEEYKIFETKRFLREVHSNSIESLIDSLIDCTKKK